MRTESAASVNGKREARGDLSATVVDDALLRLSLTAPPGPIALGSDVLTRGSSTTPAHAPSRSHLKWFDPGLHHCAHSSEDGAESRTNIPGRNPLHNLAAFYSSIVSNVVQHGPSSAKHADPHRFPVGATLPVGNGSPISMIVTINTGINASIPIDEIGDAFGKNTVLATITDQSGDATINNGDSNATSMKAT